MNPHRVILLVDDNRNDIELALLAMKQIHPAENVVTAQDGVEALDYLLCRSKHQNRPPEPPAVIFLDLKMPRLDGIGVLQHIKSHPDLKMVPIVMLTSSNHESDLKTCYSLGVNAYVIKPVAFKEFMAALEHIVTFWLTLNQVPPAK